MIDPATRKLLIWIADLGDIAVIVPAFLAAALALLLHGRRREALSWGTALLICIAVTAASKAGIGSFRFILFGHHVTAASFPSGHAGLSMVLYGGLAAFIWYGTKSMLGRLTAVALLSLETAIVLAVFLLKWHPIIDLFAGLTLGFLCLAGLFLAGVHRRRGAIEIATMLLAGGIALGAMHGIRTDDLQLSHYLARVFATMPG